MSTNDRSSALWKAFNKAEEQISMVELHGGGASLFS